MATIEKRISGAGATAYRVKIRKRGISTTETFSKLTLARKLATATEAAIEDGTYQAPLSNVPTLSKASHVTSRKSCPGAPRKSNACDPRSSTSGATCSARAC